MAYRGLKSDLDVLQTEYTPFAGQRPHHGDSDEEEDSENEAPPQRFAGGGAFNAGGGRISAGVEMTGFPRRGSGIQATTVSNAFVFTVPLQ
jgi:hypothetical protein